MVAAIPPGLAPEAPRLSAAEQYRLRGLGGVPTAANTSIKWKMEDATRSTSPSPATGTTVAARQRRKSLGDAVFGRRGAAPDVHAPITVRISSPIITLPDVSARAPTPSSSATSADQSRASAIKRKPVPIFVNAASYINIPPQTTSPAALPRPTHRRRVPAAKLEAVAANDAADSADASLPSPSSDSSSSDVYSSSSAGSPSADSDDSFAFFEAGAEGASTDDDDDELLTTPVVAYSSRAESPASQDGYTSEDEKPVGVATSRSHAPLKQSVFIERFSLDTIDRGACFNSRCVFIARVT